MRLRSPLPSLEGAAAWLNAPTNGGPPAPESGKPLLVHFWATSCGVCKETMPQVNTWRDTYGPRGLQVIAVHMPLQESDTELERVREATSRLGLSQPVAVDSQLAIADRFQNQYTPAYYVFDREGELRHFQAGNRGMDLVERRIERVLEEARNGEGGG